MHLCLDLQTHIPHINRYTATFAEQVQLCLAISVSELSYVLVKQVTYLIWTDSGGQRWALGKLKQVLVFHAEMDICSFWSAKTSDPKCIQCSLEKYSLSIFWKWVFSRGFWLNCFNVGKLQAMLPTSVWACWVFTECNNSITVDNNSSPLEFQAK